jgi:hypothetical protein
MTTLAKQIFQENPDIASESELFALGFERIRAKSGLRAARYYFWYDEDFPSDYVSEYFWLQRQVRIGVDQ